ncbi:MAG: hypothetical protein MPJ22_02610, partial [Pirellulales bacterium]|nr:hypothetical protein [Pirellulales bacterium]
KAVKMLLGAVVVLAVPSVSEVAHAEGVFGMEMSAVRNDLGVGASASGAEFAVFGQARGDVFGVHASLGNTVIPAKHEGERTDIEMLSTFDLLGMVTFGERVKGVGMFGISTRELRADSRGCTRTVCGLSGGDTAVGIKLAGGVEIPFGENWMGQWLLEYADYGTIRIPRIPNDAPSRIVQQHPHLIYDHTPHIGPFEEVNVDTRQLAITFRFGYRF